MWGIPKQIVQLRIFNGHFRGPAVGFQASRVSLSVGRFNSSTAEQETTQLEPQSALAWRTATVVVESREIDVVGRFDVNGHHPPEPCSHLHPLGRAVLGEPLRAHPSELFGVHAAWYSQS